MEQYMEDLRNKPLSPEKIKEVLYILKEDSAKLGRLFSMNNFEKKVGVDGDFRRAIYANRIYSYSGHYFIEKTITDKLVQKIFDETISLKEKRKKNEERKEKERKTEFIRKNIIDLEIHEDEIFIRLKSEDLLSLPVSTRNKAHGEFLNIKDFIDAKLQKP